MPFPAFLDAFVFYPATLRSTLLTLAEAGLYRPLWSPDVLRELQEHLPVGAEQVARLFTAMRAAFEDTMVVATTR